MDYWLKWAAAASLMLPARPDAQSTDAGARALIAKAIELRQNDRVLPRYTYFVLNHTVNRTAKGRVFLDTTTLYEYTWIGELPYGRVVELQGKPLKGKALADEQARYDKAVAEHGGLDVDARAKAKRYYVLDTSLSLEALLTTAYTLGEVRREALGGALVHVIDCGPRESGSRVATRHVTLWISDSGVVLRDAYEVIADEADRLRGSHGQEDFQLIEGNALPLHSVFHLNAPNGNTGDFESTYSRFRRFSVTTRIVPASN